ncbi:MAG: hypothetical protein V3R81_07885, partial [Gammaproteobacteria bacterium]
MVRIADRKDAPQGQSRREVIKSIALAGGALGVLGSSSPVIAQAASTFKKLPLTIAGYKFDRLAALADGRVGVEGCDAHFEAAAI